MNRNILIALGAVILLGIGAWLVYAKNSGTESTQVNSETGTSSENIQVNPAIVTSGENPQPGSTVHDLPVEPAAAAARADLAAKLGVGEKSIVIMLVENRTWSDGCLGLGGPAESCLQAQVEGFRVEMLAQGKTYVYRTDKTGASLREES